MGSYLGKWLWWNSTPELENDRKLAETTDNMSILCQLWIKYSSKPKLTKEEEEFKKYLDKKYIQGGKKDINQKN